MERNIRPMTHAPEIGSINRLHFLLQVIVLLALAAKYIICCWHYHVVRLSVCLSVTLCIVAL